MQTGAGPAAGALWSSNARQSVPDIGAGDPAAGSDPWNHGRAATILLTIACGDIQAVSGPDGRLVRRRRGPVGVESEAAAPTHQ